KKVFQQLLATDLGLGIRYVLSEEMQFIGTNAQMKKPSEVVSDGFSNLMRQTLGFFTSKNSPIVCFGGRDRDRTCDLKHAMLALSQLSYTPLNDPNIFNRSDAANQLKK